MFCCEYNEYTSISKVSQTNDRVANGKISTCAIHQGNSPLVGSARVFRLNFFFFFSLLIKSQVHTFCSRFSLLHFSIIFTCARMFSVQSCQQRQQQQQPAAAPKRYAILSHTAYKLCIFSQLVSKQQQNDEDRERENFRTENML